MYNVLELEKLKSVCGNYLNNVNLDKVKAELTEAFNPKGSLDAINLMRFVLGDNTSLLTSAVKPRPSGRGYKVQNRLISARINT